MSLFGSIMAKIFGHAAEPAPVAATPASDAAASPAEAPSVAGSAPAAGAPTPAGAGPVDVAAVLERMAAANPQPLNWRSSIVDLLKLLDLDSSLQARTALAAELHYAGDTSDSAAMNTWLHREVMQQLAQNGGKVPDDLKG